MLAAFFSFVLIADLGAEISNILVATASVITLIFIVLKKDWFYKLREVFLSNKILVSAFTVYMIFDAFSFLVFAPSFFIEKYRVIFVVLILALAIICCKNIKPSNDIMLSFFVAAFFVVIVTILVYFTPLNLPVIYTKRLSLRVDYNIFATVLLYGAIAGACYFYIEKRLYKIAVFIPIVLSVMILAGSRRVAILAPIISLFLAGVFLVYSEKPIKKTILYLLLTALLTAIIAVFLTNSLQENKTIEQKATENQLEITETTFEQRYESISSGGIFTKRKILWSFAFENISNFTAFQLVFGKGAGESIRIYNPSNVAIDTIYPNIEGRQNALSPHNMLVADLIDGGIIKLILLLILLVSIAKTSFFLFRNNPLATIAPLIILAVAVFNSMISNKFGLLYDRFFIICLAIIIVEKTAISEGGFTLEKGKNNNES